MSDATPWRPEITVARRRRRRRWPWVLLALVVLIGAAAWALGPPWIEGLIAERIDQRLAARGFTVEHRRVTWDRWTRVTVTDLRVTGPGVRASVDRVQASVSGRHLIRGRVVPTRIEVGAVDADVDLAAVKRAPRRVEPSAGSTPAPRALTVRSLSARVRRGEAPLAAFEGTVPGIDELSGGWALRLEGDAEYRGRTTAVVVEGRIRGAEVDVKVRPTDGKPVFVHARPGVGRLEAREVVLDVDGDGVHAGLGGVVLRLGAEADPVLTARAERTRVRRDAEGLRVWARGGAVDVDPARWRGARALAEALRGRVPGVDDGDRGPAPPPRIRVRDFEVAVGGSPWASAVDLALEGGSIEGSADLAGGRIAGQVTLRDGHPEAVELTLTEIDLTALPGGIAMPVPAQGRVSGTLKGVGLVDRAPLEVVADLRVAGGRLELPAVAEAPITDLDLRAAGTVRWWREAGRVQIGEGLIRLGALVARGDLDVRGLPADPRIRLDARVDPVSCTRALASVPDALLGPYRDALVGGTFAPTLTLRLRWKEPTSIRLETTGLTERGCSVAVLNTRPEGLAQISVSGGLDDVDWLERPFILTVREGVSGKRPIRVGPGTASFVPLAELPVYVGAVAYLSEEMGFYTGTGISVPLIAKAIATNLTHGRFAYGGSTVTQQLVKNLFLSRRKTLARKLQEALIASRIAAAVPKARVLELYLNCIEFGPDLYGIGPAARHYFQKDARALTPMESVFLAMLKPAPRRGRWYLRKGRTPKMTYWTTRSRELLLRLADRGHITPDAVDAAAPYILRWQDGRYLGADPPPHLP